MARAFTVLEVLMVMALLITCLGLGLFVSVTDYRHTEERAARDEIIGMLYRARSQALAYMCRDTSCTQGAPHGVYLVDPTAYILFEGDSYLHRHTSVDERLPHEEGVTIRGCSEVVFETGSGVAECDGGTFTVTEAGRTSVIHIEPSGRIWWDD